MLITTGCYRRIYSLLSGYLAKEILPKIFILPSRLLTTEELDEQDDECNVTQKPSLDVECRIRMKKYVIMMSYVGKGYYGLQRSDLNLPTIEGDLFTALLKAGIISQEQWKDPYLVQFQRASRTDKGVSALRQIISLAMKKNIDTEITKTMINNYLPPQIKVMGIKQVTRKFDAKNNCDGRIYSYLLPTFAFCPVEELCSENYRLPKDDVEKINNILKEFEGLNNYHNFTSGKEPEDKSCMRIILSCECGQPFVQNGIEFAVVRIKGQSFMMHQIRKMIGVTLAIARGLAPFSTIQKAFNNEKLDIPRAPGLGLLLENVIYERYNWKFGGHGEFNHLLWDEYQDAVHYFREKYIYPDIIETEKREKSMLKWMQQLFYSTYEKRNDDWYHPKLAYAAYRLKKHREEEESKMLSRNDDVESHVQDDLKVTQHV